MRISPLQIAGSFAALTTLVLGGVAHAQGEAASGEQLSRQLEFDQQVRPFLAKYCFDCHSGDALEGELQLDGLTDAREIAARDRATWKKVHDKLFALAMPPEDEVQPSKDERAAIVKWLSAAMDDYDCSGPIDPGHETIRRLTRYEYKNTIRDLLGVEAELADDFPMDDVGYGFDNIGDVLSLSPLLMEKYLAAAENIAGEVVIAQPLEATRRQSIDVAQMDVKESSDRGNGWRVLTSHGSFRGQFQVPAEGRYLIRTHAYGDQAGDEAARMRVSVAGASKEFEVPVASDKPAYYEFPMALKRGEQRFEIAFLNDYYQPNHPDRSRRDRNLAIRNIEVVGPLGADGLNYPEPHRRLFFVTPGDEISEQEAARRILTRLATRAFRRPATDEEIGRLMQLTKIGQQRGGRFEHGIQLALTAVLASPHFLFKIEQQPSVDDTDGIYELNEYELATRLSYFIWSSMPDDELFELASKRQLRGNLESQVRRMLADSKSEALVENFAQQWLQLRNLEQMEPDRRRFRTWNDALREDMLKETSLFFEEIVRKDRSVLQLIDADFTYVNERLARHYGISGVGGDEFQRISTAKSGRGGLLTMGGVLTVTSNPTRTSPVKRGKWIMETILGTPPPDPPADVPELEETAKVNPNVSLREQLAIHRENASCATCHRQMDALGLAFENFDAVGAWRDRDGRFEIDSSGTLPSGDEFNGPVELKRVLLSARKKDFLNCLSEKMLTYSLGRGVEYFDRCTVDAIVSALENDDHRFSRLIIEIAQSEPFQKQRAK